MDKLYLSQRLSMSDEFTYDVFLSYSSKDKDVVREIAQRLAQDGLTVWFDESVLRPGDSIPAKIEEGLEQSRVLVLCMSANAFGSDWARLEAGTFQFRDPLNSERRFVPLRLDETPIKGALMQFLYINWRSANRESEYVKLLEACEPTGRLRVRSSSGSVPHSTSGVLPLDLIEEKIQEYYFGANRYTSIKLFLTPSLYARLPMVAKPMLVAALRQKEFVHLIHPEVGLGMLPERTVQQFFQMASHLDEYERAKVLPQEDGGFAQTVREWIDEKSEETPHLVQQVLRTHVLSGRSVAEADLDLVRAWESRFRAIIWPLIRFTFHVGNLYRCDLREIVVLCANEEEQRWITYTCEAATEVVESCDLFSAAPHYRFRYLPPLRALLSQPDVDRIIHAVHSVFPSS